MAGEMEEKNTKENQTENNNSVDLAQKINSIIEQGLSSGNIGSMNEKLDDVIDSNTSKVCIFENQPLCNWKIVILILAVLTIFFVWAEMTMARVMPLAPRHRLILTVSMLIVLILILINMWVGPKLYQDSVFDRRYRKYYDLLHYKMIEIVAELSDVAKVSEQQVIKDIQKAIQMRLIPEGHLCVDNQVIVLSNELYREYKGNEHSWTRYYEKLIEEYKTEIFRPKEIQDMLDTGQDYIRSIHQLNDEIDDKTVSEKLDTMEKIVTAIFREVDIMPVNAEKLGLLLNYYLPTTEKLLKEYVQLNQMDIQGGNIVQTKIEIENSLGRINKAYEQILDNFFFETHLDVSSDIDAMKKMMDKGQTHD
jgi:hypothetical protein